MDWTNKTCINKTWTDKTWINKTWIEKTWLKISDGHHTTPALSPYWKLYGPQSFALTGTSIKRFSLAIRYEGRLLEDFC